MSSLWEKLTSEYLFYASEDPVVKKSAFEYYPLLKQVFLSRAATDSKGSVHHAVWPSANIPPHFAMIYN